ncbi:hypothetical protein GH714_034896 [Hevea brasiliensis]|uniref:HMG box domain-containing protein n=1 Tax=Hevea brasiliensis TaxID=3981 RepID=A0A6A6MJG7_HEVBR|nr:hypothetical protein GH714_034896 [Hevea brasiliensis]
MGPLVEVLLKRGKAFFSKASVSASLRSFSSSSSASEIRLAMKGGKSNANASKFDAKLKVNGAGGGQKASKKAGKDPNKPKRPASAFFVFMEEFRQEYKEKHPNNKSVAVVGKAGGDKWKSMSEAAGGGNADDESDKSKSEVNDEERKKMMSNLIESGRSN